MKPEGRKHRVISIAESLPKPGTWVTVITASYRCMGYLDEQGKWRDIQHNRVIEGVQAWVGSGEADTTGPPPKSGDRAGDQQGPM